MARLLGIDYGQKRFGFALSDPTGMLASNLEVKEYKTQKEIVDFVIGLCEKHQAKGIVIGWPLNMNGSLGPSAEAVQKFIEAMEEKSDLPIHKWDERLTTKAAQDILIEAGTRREKRKHLVDKMAAQLILQGFLDAGGGE